MPELQMGQQEQELRQLLNKDKSKRSKGGSLPRRVHGPLCCGGRRMPASVGVSACQALRVNAGGGEGGPAGFTEGM